MESSIDKLIVFIKNEFSKEAGEISEAIDLLSLTLDGLLEHANISLAQSQRDRDFSKSKELVSFSEEISHIQAEIVKFGEDLQDEVVMAEDDDTEDKADSALNESIAIPNYEEYRVDQTVPHTLYESFTYKKACAFSFRGKKYSVKDWKDLLIQICELLCEIDLNKVNSFINDRLMVGSRIHYFGVTYVPNKNEKLKNADIYVWINLSSNGKRNIIRKMLKKFNIPFADFSVYLRADYTPLHQINQ